MEIWRLKEDIESLSYQLRNANNALEAQQEAEALYRATSCQTER